MRLVGAASLLIALAATTQAWADANPLSDCSGTAGVTSAAITFPKSGGTGPSFPQQYLEITNPSASATLWVNPTGGAAAANAAGSAQIAVGGYLWFSGPVQPGQMKILASAGSTPYTCWYR